MKTALITGANRGIGWQVAQDLSNLGWNVLLGTRAAGKTGQPVPDFSGSGTWITLDVADSQSISEAGKWANSSHPQIDVLINNAGIYPDENTSILTAGRDEFEHTFQTNVFGVVETTRAFLPMLRAADAARIIHVSSGYGQLDNLQPGVPTYCLSKLALNGVTLMQSRALQSEKISVNAISPGWVRTEMGGSGADRTVEEGAAGIVWLATEAAHELTGKFFRDQEEIDW